MKTKILILFITIIFSFLFIIFYLGLKNPNIYTPDLGIEKKIPTFKAKVFSSKNLLSSEEIFISDEFYLLNIWSSWCAPCRKEHTFLMQLSKKKNIKMIGLNYKDDDQKAKNFLNELSSPFGIILSDPKGIIAIEWGAYGVPETFIIHKKKIIKKIIGPIDEVSILEIKKIIR